MLSKFLICQNVLGAPFVEIAIAIGVPWKNDRSKFLLMALLADPRGQKTHVAYRNPFDISLYDDRY